jgi:predicted anti-sigma-YlaC factor YlaD
MEMSGGQLCARARFWASLRVDGELSELEGALLDAHLARCAECREVAAGFAGATVLLRSAQQERVAPVAVGVRRAPRRLLASVAVAALLLLGVVAGSLVRAEVSTDAASTPHLVAVVANMETPDQIRRLRRTTLLNTRKLPRDISAEPV